MNDSLSVKEELARRRTRASLVNRMKDLADEESWRQFYDGYWRLIYRYALKRSLTEDEAEETLQRTMITVAKKWPAFTHNGRPGALRKWLCSIARLIVLKVLAERRCQLVGLQGSVHEVEREESVEELPDPVSLTCDDLWEVEWKRNLLDVAMDQVKKGKKVSLLEFQIFDYHVLKECSVEETMRTFGCASGTVYSAKHRVEEALGLEVQKLLANDS